jgi:hypothetical protein
VFGRNGKARKLLTEEASVIEQKYAKARQVKGGRTERD